MTQLVFTTRAAAAAAVAFVLVLSGCWSSNDEVRYDGPREELVDACGRAVSAGPHPSLDGQRIVENVTVSDPDSRYPIVEGELVGAYSGSSIRYRFTCEIPEGDDYLAAQITALTLVE